MDVFQFILNGIKPEKELIMNNHANKIQENKSQAVSAVDSQLQGSGEATFQFMDNRTEAIAQRKLQEMASNSQQDSQLKIFQGMANKSLQVKQVAQLQAMEDNNTPVKKITQLKGVIQRMDGPEKDEYFSKALELLKKHESEMEFDEENIYSLYKEGVFDNAIEKGNLLNVLKFQGRAGMSEQPQHYYHGTPIKYLKLIQDSGLASGKAPGLTAKAIGARVPTEKDATHVFMYPDATNSKDLANRLEQTIVLLRVDINQLNKDLINITKDELQYNGIIPPSVIEVNTKEGNWLSLEAIEFIEKQINGIPVPTYIVPDYIGKIEESSDEEESWSDED
jgi:hypothetical protein